MHSSEKNFPIIDLGDFILREKQEEDIEDFFRYYSDPEVNKNILTTIPQDLEDARRELYYWRNIFYQNDGIYFAIATKNDNKIIGSIGLTSYNIYNSRIELSYDLAKEFWRKGIMTKAIKAVLAYGFQSLDVNRIEAFTSVENIASRNLLLKCNFTFEGVLRQHRYHNNSYRDACVFSLLRSEFNPNF